MPNAWFVTKGGGSVVVVEVGKVSVVVTSAVDGESEVTSEKVEVSVIESDEFSLIEGVELSLIGIVGLLVVLSVMLPVAAGGVEISTKDEIETDTITGEVVSETGDALVDVVETVAEAITETEFALDDVVALKLSGRLILQGPAMATPQTTTETKISVRILV